MKRVFGLLVFALALSSGQCAEPQSASSFDFQSVDVSTAISLYLKEVSRKPYLLCNDVLSDSRKVSIRAEGKTLAGPLFEALLAHHGYSAIEKSGVVTVCKKDAQVVKSDGEAFLYKTKHRDAAYLIDLISPLLKGVFANRRTSVAGALSVGGDTDAAKVQGGGTSGGLTSAYKASSIDDYVVFSGEAEEVERLKRLLNSLDVPVGEVVIKAYMYEVGSNDSDASALGLVLSALKGKFQLSAGSDPVGNLLRFKSGAIDLIASSLKSDGRFKVVTAPYQRVRSGKSARFVSGSQVSIIGAIATNQNGTTQQSFDRVESGTIMEIAPTVHASGIDIELFQQMSAFVSTEHSQQPTLNKRELRTSLTVRDSEVIVIGGLDDTKMERAESGISLLPFSLAKSVANRRSQMILLLEVSKVSGMTED